MKIGNIITSNLKGQIVIPASIRAQLGITDQVPLQLVVKGSVLYITPIRDVITVADQESSYFDILTKTKGTWRNEKSVSIQRKQLELEASDKRKTAW